MEYEIRYERNLTGSFMKIQAQNADGGLDEKIALHCALPGLIPLKKYQMDGETVYVYTISGKQSLETVCNIKPADLSLVEQLIISICCQAEILERYLMDTNCLLLDPATVFLGNQPGDILYTVLPSEHTSLLQQIRGLMEYLLTKIDHEDKETVHAAYRLYERTLEEGYSMKDLKAAILEGRHIAAIENSSGKELPQEQEVETNPQTGRNIQAEKQTIPAKRSRTEKYETDGNERISVPEEKTGCLGRLLAALFGENEESDRKERDRKMTRKKKNDIVILPEDAEPEPEPEIFETVCLANYHMRPEGILIYEGSEGMENIRLDKTGTLIGTGADSTVQVRKETISRCHARIICKEGEYYLEDLNSTNGTYVNGELLAYKESRRLSANDQVWFADVKYRFV